MPLAFLSRPAFPSRLFSNLSSSRLAAPHNCRPTLSPSRLAIVRVMSSSAEAPPTEYVTAFTTVPTEEAGTKIAEGLLEGKLAACVNTIPNVKSTYTWEGKVEHDTELLLMIKTRASLVPQVTELVNKIHPFDVPELIVHSIIAGNPTYLNWIGDATKDAAS